MQEHARDRPGLLRGRGKGRRVGQHFRVNTFHDFKARLSYLPDETNGPKETGGVVNEKKEHPEAGKAKQAGDQGRQLWDNRFDAVESLYRKEKRENEEPDGETNDIVP